MQSLFNILIANTPVRGSGSYNQILVILLPVLFIVIGYKLTSRSLNPEAIIQKSITLSLISLSLFILLVLATNGPNLKWNFYVVYCPIYYYASLHLGLTLGLLL